MSHSIIGTWQLVRATSVAADGSTMPAPYGGKTGMGLVTFTDSGRMMAVLCNGATSLPAGQGREYVSYCGNFSYDGEHLKTQVDASSRADWQGSEQVRSVAFEGDVMVLRPPLRAYSAQAEQRTLYWQKIA